MDASEEPTCPPRLGRLVNHGRRQERNAVMKVLVCNGAPELCLFATKPIAAGTEILYDYGVKVPWESEVIVSLCFSLVIRVFEMLIFCSNTFDLTENSWT